MSRQSGVPRRGDPFRSGEGAQSVFRAVLDAMARPGTVFPLPVIDEHAPIAAGRSVAAIAQTLLDHEVTFAVAPGDDIGSVADAQAFGAYVRTVTGCRETAISEADYVFSLGSLPSSLPATLKPGLPAYPDEGATLVSLVPPLDGVTGFHVGLTGPGVRPGTVATIPGWSEADLASLVAANANPPLGIDVILVDATGRVLCLPRSTRTVAAGLPHTQEMANGLYRG